MILEKSKSPFLDIDTGITPGVVNQNEDINENEKNYNLLRKQRCWHSWSG
jgi:hypothetical protein